MGLEELCLTTRSLEVWAGPLREVLVVLLRLQQWPGLLMISWVEEARVARVAREAREANQGRREKEAREANLGRKERERRERKERGGDELFFLKISIYFILNINQ